MSKRAQHHEAKALKRIGVDLEGCAGCRVCETACSYTHTGRFGTSLSRVTVVKRDDLGIDYPVFCHQCAECTALSACPTGAMTRRYGGVVAVDETACTSCGFCVRACKYSAVKLSDGKAIVCDLCEGEPACVARCPTKALSFEEGAGEPKPPEEEFMKLLRRWGVAG